MVIMLQTPHIVVIGMSEPGGPVLELPLPATPPILQLGQLQLPILNIAELGFSSGKLVGFS